MALLDFLRTKSPVDRPHSAVLEQGIADVDAGIDKNRADAQALTDELPSAVIRSLSGSPSERKRRADLEAKLANLNAEHTGLLSTAAALRRELDEALEREAQASLDAEWEALVAPADAL